MECLNKTLSKSRMRQGEAFPLRFTIFTKAEPETGTPSKIVVGSTPGENEVLAEKIAITVGTLKKYWDPTMTDYQIKYDPTSKLWFFPISQKESLSMAAGEYAGSIKVKFPDDEEKNIENVLISEIDPLIIIESIDKEEL